jgi:hypothetical protein
VPSFEVLVVGDSSKSNENSEVVLCLELINCYINCLPPASVPVPDFIFNKVLAFSGNVDHR